jgi:hypothetical protein
MARELLQDGDVMFESFASYPNSSTFEPNKTLSSSKNARITAGTISPRKGSQLMVDFGSQVDFSCSAHGKTGDSILVFGPNVRIFCNDNSSVSVPSLAAKQKVRGQGYADAICMESGDSSFTAGCNVIERLATAKNDQIRFSLYGGANPYDADTLSLVQCTYDNIQALEYKQGSLFAFGKRSIYGVKPGLGFIASKDKQQSMHNVVKMSSFDGIAGPEAVASIGGFTAFFDLNNGPSIKVMEGDKFKEGDASVSSSIKDIMQKIDLPRADKVCAAAYDGRIYFALPFSDKWRVLVLNTQNKGLFESLDEYPFSPDKLMVARKNGIPRLWAMDSTTGRLYLLDEGSTDSGTDVTTEVLTREYAFRSLADKRYDGFFVKMDNADGAAVDVKALFSCPDSEIMLDTFSAASGATIRRGLINKRAMSMQIKIVVKSGSPRILAIGTEASIAGRSLFGLY